MQRVLLQDGDMRVALLDHGAITQGWWLADRPLILGYDDPAAYLTDPYFMGAIVGPLANRVGGAAFTLGGRTHLLQANEGPNQLHGGPQGFWSRPWDIQVVTATMARFVLHAGDGEGGYPGPVDVTLTVRLTAPRMTYEFCAHPGQPTPISLAQHNYYTLGQPGIRANRLHLPASRTLALDPQQIPTGDRIAVTDATDFREAAPLTATLDDYYIFDPMTELRVTLTAPDGLRLQLRSDQPGLQVYTGQGLGAPFAPFDAVCLEPSGYPDAVNQDSFPSVIATPDAPYRQVMHLDILGPE